MTREFRLSPAENGQGVSCNANGAFVGTIALLERSSADGTDRWQPRRREQLSKQLSSRFGIPVDLSSKAGGLKAVCNALNEGDIARAQIATVLLGIPDPPELSNSAHSEDELIKFVRDLHMSGMIAWDDIDPYSSLGSAVAPENCAPRADEGALTKTGYNADEPRDDHGRWTDDGGGSAAQIQNSSWLSLISSLLISPAEAAPRSDRTAGPRVNPNAVSFIQKHRDAAQRLANQIPGVTPEMILAALGRECAYGTDWKATQYGNYAGVHFDDWTIDTKGNRIPVGIDQRGVRPFLPGQTGTFWTAGVPSPSNPDVRIHRQEMAAFPLDRGFELSGQIAIEKIKPYVPKGGVESPETFFRLLSDHGFGIGNPNYMRDTLEVGPPTWGAYWQIIAASREAR